MLARLWEGGATRSCLRQRADHDRHTSTANRNEYTSRWTEIPRMIRIYTSKIMRAVACDCELHPVLLFKKESR